MLSEKLAVDAAVCVTAYLRANANGPPVFSLRQSDATMDLATRHARCASVTQDMWRVEQAAAEQRRTAHWNKVLAKQRELVGLDTTLRQLESSLISKKSLKREFNLEGVEEVEIGREISELQLNIATQNAAIKRAEMPPAPELQPLP